MVSKDTLYVCLSNLWRLVHTLGNVLWALVITVGWVLFVGSAWLIVLFFLTPSAGMFYPLSSEVLKYPTVLYFHCFCFICPYDWSLDEWIFIIALCPALLNLFLVHMSLSFTISSDLNSILSYISIATTFLETAYMEYIFHAFTFNLFVLRTKERNLINNIYWSMRLIHLPICLGENFIYLYLK